MRLAVFALMAFLAGCAQFDSDDYCVLVAQQDGVVRCAAWVIK